jgi:hypothetical protein
MTRRPLRPGERSTRARPCRVCRRPLWFVGLSSGSCVADPTAVGVEPGGEGTPVEVVTSRGRVVRGAARAPDRAVVQGLCVHRCPRSETNSSENSGA